MTSKSDGAAGDQGGPAKPATEERDAGRGDAGRKGATPSRPEAVDVDAAHDRAS